MRLCIAVHTYIRTYIHTYVHTYIHTHIHTYIHTYVYTDKICYILYVCMYAVCEINSRHFANFDMKLSLSDFSFPVTILGDELSASAQRQYHAVSFASE